MDITGRWFDRKSRRRRELDQRIARLERQLDRIERAQKVHVSEPALGRGA